MSWHQHVSEGDQEGGRGKRGAECDWPALQSHQEGWVTSHQRVMPPDQRACHALISKEGALDL